MGDGDGWSGCDRGHEHWGRFGAAGLLLYHPPTRSVLLQHRAWWTIGGRTWGVLGGARHSHEDSVAAALREAAEESTLDPAAVRVHGVICDDHGGWSYDTVIASVTERLDVRPGSRETKAVAWVPVDEAEQLPLFEPFAVSWPKLREALRRLVVVVDAANVVGARADGWWRDRVGANTRLRDDLSRLAATGVTGLPIAWPELDRWYPEIVLVVEGAAKRIGQDGAGVRVVAAPGSADDAIVDLVARPECDETYLVVTADRELRERCRAVGAEVVGPRWLLDLLG